MAQQQPRNPLLPDLTQQPQNGLQAAPVGQDAPGASPFQTPQAFGQAQFTGSGSEPYVQSDLALAREQETNRNNLFGSNATFDADLRRRADETYAEFERSLNPQWETRAREFEQSLIGRGIDPNSEAGQRARDDFNRSRTDAFSQARRTANADGVALQNQRWQQQFAQQQADAQHRLANASMNAGQANLAFDRDWRQREFDENRRRYDEGFGEDVRRYDQGFDFNSGQADFDRFLQMLSADQSMTGFNNSMNSAELNSILPFLGMIPQGGPAGIDVMSPYNMQQQAQQFNAQQRQQADNGMWGALGSIGRMFLPSDEAVKYEARQVGTLHNGLPVYAYRYKWGGPTQIGVMAQDVEKVNPEAVIEVNGVKLVNYDLAVA